MSNRSIFFVVVAGTFLFVPTVGSAADSVKAAPETKASVTTTDINENPWRTAYTRLRLELKEAREDLGRGNAELAKLRHRWIVQKGRVPTSEEIKEYEKKLAEGKAKPGENPYVNKNPLSSPGLARVAYYAKLDEVHQKEEHLRQLTDELAALDRKADQARIPADQRVESPADRGHLDTAQR